MSDLVNRLHNMGAAICDEAADRIEWLEDQTQQKAGEAVLMVKHIDRLEAALREIKDQYLTPDQSSAIARAALDQKDST